MIARSRSSLLKHKPVKPRGIKNVNGGPAVQTPRQARTDLSMVIYNPATPADRDRIPTLVESGGYMNPTRSSRFITDDLRRRSSMNPSSFFWNSPVVPSSPARSRRSVRMRMELS